MVKARKQKPGWQARVGRLLTEDTAKEGQKQREEENNKRKAKRKRDAAADEEEEEDTPEAAEARRREMYKTENKGTQLFVGNLPFEATEEEVTERFSAFGKVHRVLLVRDKESGRPRGIGFVHFKSEAGVQKALKEAENRSQLAAMEPGAKGVAGKAMTRKQQKREIFKGRADGMDEGILFNGRVLSVKGVVSKKAAAGLTRQAEREKEHEALSDPRNLKLLDEGRITPNSPAANGLSENRIALLNNRFQVKKRKLKDPNFFVSPTRLCIRDLPSTVDDAGLKKLALGPIRAFTAANPDFKFDTNTKQNPFIKMFRVVRDTASQASKGFGFVEFRDHEVALHVLRELNNNPKIFSGKRLDVEFAVESVHALRKLKNISDKSKERNQVMRQLAQKGEDPKEGWRRLQDEKEAKKAADKAARKKEFEKYKKFQKYTARKVEGDAPHAKRQKQH